MEDFGSLTTSPLLASEEFAERADMVVLLLGERYGSHAPEEGFSFTHAEWQIIRRDRIPCLVYLKEVDESALGHEIAALRKQVSEELVCSSYRDRADLESKLRRDLQRELKAIPPDGTQLMLAITPPSLLDREAFQGREEELARLSAALANRDSRVGVWGPAGIGKTTFVRQFFIGDGGLDPLWLRVDDLFATDPAGRRRIEAMRWDRESLLDELMKLKEAHPRAVFVFDNVQAAPLAVRWLTNRLGPVPCVFLAWDTDALPQCNPIIRLRPLADEQASAVLRHYVEVTRGSNRSLENLCKVVGNYPLLLHLCGRRLRFDKSLTVDELIADLERATDRLALHGPTIDREHVQVRRVLVSSYLCLIPAERRALTAIAATPSGSISPETMVWVISRFSRGEFQRMNRAIALGLLEARPRPDWRGRRYSLSELVIDFLRTTEAYSDAQAEFGRYLKSRDALKQSSSETVAAALQSQLETTAPLVPFDGDWLESLIFTAKSDIRSRVSEVLRSLSNRTQIERLAAQLAELLARPREEKCTITALRLLTEWKVKATEGILDAIWLKPRVLNASHGTALVHSVGEEAGRALAALSNIGFADFVKQEIGQKDSRRRRVAIEIAGACKLLEVRAEIIAALNDPSLKMREYALASLAYYNPEPEICDTVYHIFEKESGEFRQRAAWTLGAWKDERILQHLLKFLDSPEANERAHTISILLRYPRDEVAQRLLSLALEDPAPNVRTLASFTLADFGHPLAGEAALALLQSQDTLIIGIFVVIRSSDTTGLVEDVRERLRTKFYELIGNDLVQTRLAARTALLKLRDARACDGLWSDIESQDSLAHPSYRWFPINQLAEWRPPDFDSERLRPLLHDDDPWMRQQACLVAGQMRAASLRDELQLLISDDTIAGAEQVTVARYASEALDRIAGKRPPWVPHKDFRRPMYAR